MRTFSIGRISTVTGLLVLAGGVAAATGASDDNALSAPGSQEEHKGGSHGKDVYGIVNLEGGDFAFIAGINRRGQAAFEYFGLDGQVHVGYFDGTRTVDITPTNSEVALLGALNDKGEVGFAARVAEAGSPGPYPFRPFRWSAPRGLVPLPSLSSEGNTFITAINNRSEIVGRSALENVDGAYRAVRWSAANRLVQLPAPAGIGQTFASDINDHGITAGDGDRASGGPSVLAWDAAARVTNLGSFGASLAVASYNNNRGEIAGMLDTTGPGISAFLWSPGRGPVRVGTGTVTHALGDNGELVGRSYATGDAPRAFLFTRARGLLDLHPRGLAASEANDVNDRGVIVGLGARALGENYAYRWTRGGGAVDLNTRLLNPPAGLVVTSALGISDNGDIIADSNAGPVILRPNGGGTDAPVLGPFQHAQPRLNQPLELAVSFRDRNAGDTHSATIDWGDGSGPQAVSVREYRGRGEVRATHTYASEGDFNIVLRVRDSSGRTTQLWEQITIRELGTPMLSGQGVIEDGAATRLKFRLSAPVSLKSGAATPFSFQLHGRTAFKGEQLDRVTQEGNTLRLEGRGRLNGQAGYRFVIDAVAGDASAGTGRMSVRITGTDAAGQAQRAVLAAGSGRQAQSGVLAASLRHGSIRLTR